MIKFIKKGLHDKICQLQSYAFARFRGTYNNKLCLIKREMKYGDLKQ